MYKRQSSEGFGFDPSFETQGQATFLSKEGALIHIWAGADAPKTELKIEVFCESGEVTLDAGRVIRAYRNTVPETLFDGAMPTPAGGFRAAIEGFQGKASRIAPAKEAVLVCGLVEEMIQTQSDLRL